MIYKVYVTVQILFIIKCYQFGSTKDCYNFFSGAEDSVAFIFSGSFSSFSLFATLLTSSLLFMVGLEMLCIILLLGFLWSQNG